MEFAAIVLVITGAVFQALGQVNQSWLTKKTRILNPNQFLFVQNAFSLIPLMIALPVFFIIDGWTFFTWENHGIFALFTCVSLVVNGAIQVANAKSRQLADISLLAPIQAATPLIVSLSAIILNEWPSKQGWIGVGLISLGTYIHAREKAENLWAYLLPLYGWVARDKRDPEAVKEALGIRYAWCSAFMGTLGLISDALMARSGSVALGGMIQKGILAAHFYGRARQESAPGELGKKIRAHWPNVVFAGVAWGLQFVLVVTAFRLAPVAHTGGLKRLSVPLAVLFAWHFLGETKAKFRIWPALIATAGAVLLASDYTTGKVVGRVEELFR